MRNGVCGIRRSRTSGTSGVEAALVLLLMIVVFIGVVDLGQVLVFHQAIVERARAGAHWGVLNPYDSARIKNVVVYSNPDPPAGALPLFSLEPGMVTTALVDQSTPEARLVVTINDYRFYFFTPLVAGAKIARPISVSMPVEAM